MLPPMIFGLYKPEDVYNSPSDNTLILPLNGEWVGHKVSFEIQDDGNFDLGSVPAEIVKVAAYGQYGDKYLDKRRPDREIKFTLFLSGDESLGATPTDLRNAIYELQSVLNQATDYSLSSFSNNTGKTLGSPLMLKYAPTENDVPVYFIVKQGHCDFDSYNENISLTTLTATIEVTITTGYGAYDKLVTLENFCVNGSFIYGGKYWYNDEAHTVPAFSYSPFPASTNHAFPYVQTSDNFDGFQGIITNPKVQVENGLETLLGHPLDEYCPFAAGIKVYNTDAYFMYSEEINLPKGDFYMWPSVMVKNIHYMNLVIEGKTIGGGSYWTGVAELDIENIGEWSKQSISEPVFINANSYSKIRVRFYCQKFFASVWSPETSYVKEVAIWLSSGSLPLEEVRLPKEYVSQPYSLTESAHVFRVQGNLETNSRIRLRNASSNIMQQVHVGAKKQLGNPIPFYLPFGDNYESGKTITVDDIKGSVLAMPKQYQHFAKLFHHPQSYRVFARLKTDGPHLGMGIVGSGSSTTLLTSSSYRLVPNNELNSLPNTTDVIQTVNLGTVQLPPHRIDGLLPFTGGSVNVPELSVNFFKIIPDFAINVTLYGLWFIPLTIYNETDTRRPYSGLPGDFNLENWLNDSMLTYNSLFKDNSTLQFSRYSDKASYSTFLTARTTDNPLKLYPNSESDNTPMSFSAIAREWDGINYTLPKTDVDPSTKILWLFQYCPTYEF